MTQIELWAIFGLIVVVMLALDLGIFHRDNREITVKESLIWSAIWIGLAFLFGVVVYLVRGPDSALKFVTGYLLEESLSVDNLFVFLLIFSFFQVPRKAQYKVLFWGIAGAMVMRMLFILVGVALIHRFAWVIYLFGAFLVYTGVKLAFEKDKEIEPEKNLILKIFRRVFPITKQYEGESFFVKRDLSWMATPLFVVLLVVESTDIIFAVDSIPAILAITTDPFIVYTSNIFAILGLRSIFFALAGLMGLFRFLNYGLAFVLCFIGFKMMIGGWIKIPIGIALGVIVLTLAISIVASLMIPETKKTESNS